MGEEIMNKELSGFALIQSKGILKSPLRNVINFQRYGRTEGGGNKEVDIIGIF